VSWQGPIERESNRLPSQETWCYAIRSSTFSRHRIKEAKYSPRDAIDLMKRGVPFKWVDKFDAVRTTTGRELHFRDDASGFSGESIGVFFGQWSACVPPPDEEPAADVRSEIR